MIQTFESEVIMELLSIAKCAPWFPRIKGFIVTEPSNFEFEGALLVEVTTMN